MTQAHLEQRLKDLQGNLSIMQELSNELFAKNDINNFNLICDKIELQESNIALVKGRIEEVLL